MQDQTATYRLSVSLESVVRAAADALSEHDLEVRLEADAAIGVETESTLESKY